MTTRTPPWVPWAPRRQQQLSSAPGAPGTHAWVASPSPQGRTRAAIILKVETRTPSTERARNQPKVTQPGHGGAVTQHPRLFDSQTHGFSLEELWGLRGGGLCRVPCHTPSTVQLQLCLGAGLALHEGTPTPLAAGWGPSREPLSAWLGWARQAVPPLTAEESQAWPGKRHPLLSWVPALSLRSCVTSG